MRLPSRCVHAFRVLGDRARFLHVSVGRGAVAAFRDLATVPAEPTADDAPAFLELLERHGIDLVLPEGVDVADLAGAAS